MDNLIGKSLQIRFVSEDKEDLFEQMLEENKSVVPCELWINKDTGVVYFKEKKGMFSFDIRAWVENN